MAIHQADLVASKRAQEKIDRDAIQAYLVGEGDLADGLSITPEVVDGLRRQALALHTAGKWQRCIDVILGLVALGSIHPADAMMLSDSYRHLGRFREAEACAEHAERILSAMGIELPPELEGNTR